MAIEAELFDGTILEFPDGTDPSVIQATAKRLTEQRRPAAQPAPAKNSILQDVGDLGASFVGGAGSLLSGIGTLIDVANQSGTSPRGVAKQLGIDLPNLNVLSAIGKPLTEFAEQNKSQALKAAERRRSAAADKEERTQELGAAWNAAPDIQSKFAAIRQYGPDAGLGLLKQAYVSGKETITDPRLLANFVAEQIPSLALTAGAGKVAQGAAAGVGAAEKLAARVGAATGVGTAATLQGADIAGETYNRIMALPDTDWVQTFGYVPPLAEKQKVALDAAKEAGLKSGAVSLGTMAIPGGTTLEKAFLKGVPKRGVITSAAGESLANAIEEGYGQYAGNVGVGEVTPTQNPFQNVGTTAGQAAAGSGIIGGIAGFRGAEGQTATPPPAGTPLTGTAPAATAEQLDLGMEIPDQPATTPITATSPSGITYESQVEKAHKAAVEEQKAAEVENRVRDLRHQVEVFQNEQMRLKAQYEAETDPAKRQALLEAGAKNHAIIEKLNGEIVNLRKKVPGLARPGSPAAEKEAAAAGQLPLDFNTPAQPPTAAPAQPPTAAPTGQLELGLEAPAQPTTVAPSTETPFELTPPPAQGAQQLELPLEEAPPTAAPGQAAFDFGEAAPAAPSTVVTDDQVTAMGFAKNTAKPLRAAIVGKDLSDPKQAAEVRNAIETHLNKYKITPKKGVTDFLATLPQEKKENEPAPKLQPLRKRVGKPVPSEATTRETEGPTRGPVVTTKRPARNIARGTEAIDRSLITPKPSKAEKAADRAQLSADIETAANIYDIAKRKDTSIQALMYLEDVRTGNKKITPEKLRKQAEETLAELRPSEEEMTKAQQKLASARRATPTKNAKQLKKLEKAKQQQEATERQEAAADLRKESRNLKTEDVAGEEFIGDEILDLANELGFSRPARWSVAESTEPTGNTVDNVREKLHGVFQEKSRFDQITTVVQSEADLPADVRASEDYTPGTRGVAYKGKVWLVADNIPRKQELAVFLHEAGAHLGFDQVLSEADRNFLASEVRNWAKGTDLKAQAAKAAIAKAGKSVDELIAYTVEELIIRGVKPVSFRPESTWLRRVLDAFKTALKKLGLRQAINEQDLVNLAFGAAHIAIKAPTPVTTGKPRFSRPTTPEELLAQQVFKGPNPNAALINAVTNPGNTLMKTRVAMTYQGASLEDKLRNIFGNKTKTATGETNPVEYLNQADNVPDLAETVKEKGSIKADKDGILYAVGGEASLVNVGKTLRKLAERTGASGKDVESWFSLASSARREKGLDAAVASGLIDLADRAVPVLNANQIQAGLELIKQHPELGVAIDQWTAFKNGLVDKAVEYGVFTKELGNFFKLLPDYVPWFRETENEFGNVTPKMSIRAFSRKLSDTSEMRKLKGGSISVNPVANVLDNMDMLSTWLASKAAKNYYGLKLADAMESNGLVKQVPAPLASSIDSPSKITLLRGGDAVYFEAADPLDAAAFKGRMIATDMLTRVLAMPANILRKYIVLAPGFSLAQLPVDLIRASVTVPVKYPMLMAARALRNFAFEIISPSSIREVRELADYGILPRADMSVNEAREFVGKNRLSTREGFVGGLRRIIDKLDSMSKASDAAVRAAIYQQLMAETNDPLAARRAAREVINFNRAGASGLAASLRATIPFIGVYLNSMDLLYRSIQGKGLSTKERDQAKLQFMYQGMRLAMLSMVYAALMSDDDDYNKLDDHARNSKIYIPGGYSVPVPTDSIGFAFFALPVQLTHYFMTQGTENEKDTAKLVRGIREGLVTALASPNILVPAAVKPEVELALNRDFFSGLDIVGLRYKGLEKAEQYNDNTTEFAKLIGRQANISPLQIDHWLRGHLGTMGVGLVALTNGLINNRPGISAPDMPMSNEAWAKILGSSYFVSHPERAAGLKEDFYELKEVTRRVVDTFNHYINTGQGEAAKEYISGKEKMFAVGKTMPKFAEVLEDLRKMKALIRNRPDSEMSPAQKRAKLEEIEKAESLYLTRLNLTRLRNIGLQPTQ
jgi:hypothetical protein